MTLQPDGRGRQFPAFHVRFRGFDRGEVVAALTKLASENEEARREVAKLGTELHRLQASVTELRDGERHTQRALISAHKAADEIRERAEQEARRIVGDADGVRERAEQEARRIVGDVDGVREQAEQQARRIVRDAEERAELLVEQGRERVRQVEEHYDTLMARRQEAETAFEAFIKVLAESLDRIRQQHGLDSGESADNGYRDALAPTA